MKRSHILGPALLAAFILSGVEQVTAQTANPTKNKEFTLHQSPEGTAVQRNDYYIKPEAIKKEIKKSEPVVMINPDGRAGYVFSDYIRMQNDTSGLYVYKSTDNKSCFTGTHQVFDKKQYQTMREDAVQSYQAPQYQGYGVEVGYIKRSAAVNPYSLQKEISEICNQAQLPVENKHQPHTMPPAEFLPGHIKDQTNLFQVKMN